jgi:hypothetical protein
VCAPVSVCAQAVGADGRVRADRRWQLRCDPRFHYGASAAELRGDHQSGGSGGGGESAPVPVYAFVRDSSVEGEACHAITYATFYPYNGPCECSLHRPPHPQRRGWRRTILLFSSCSWGSKEEHECVRACWHGRGHVFTCRSLARARADRVGPMCCRVLAGGHEADVEHVTLLVRRQGGTLHSVRADG